MVVRRGLVGVSGHPKRTAILDGLRVYSLLAGESGSPEAPFGARGVVRMRKHGGFYENASWVRPHRLFETAQHTGALTGCDCGVGAAGRHLRRSPRARAARGDCVSWFYGVLKCSPGAKSHAEIAALVRDEAAARRPPQARSKLIWDASSVPRW